MLRRQRQPGVVDSQVCLEAGLLVSSGVEERGRDVDHPGSGEGELRGTGCA